MNDAIIITGRTPPTHCPSCRRMLDGITGVSGRMPRPGDGSLCGYCGAENVFDKQLNLRPMTKKERKLFARKPEYRIMRNAARIAIKKMTAKLN